MAAYFLVPEDDQPWGGIRKIYNFVDILNHHGMDASVVHGIRGYRCTWFANQTAVRDADGLCLDSGRDVLVIPEVYGPRITALAPGIPRIVLVQNPYELFSSFPAGVTSFGLDSAHDVDFAVVVSEDSLEFMTSAFPDLGVRRIVLGIDTEMFRPRPTPHPAIAFMPRKDRQGAATVCGLLRASGVLDDWRLTEIDSCAEREAAALLGRSTVFLSLSRREGFGLPPLEAMASGCVVIGFDGNGGREYFDPDIVFRVDDGDLLGIADAATRVVRQLSLDPSAFDHRIEAGIRLVRERYGFARMEQSVLAAFQRDPSRDRGRVVVLRNEDVRFASRSPWRRTLRPRVARSR